MIEKIEKKLRKRWLLASIIVGFWVFLGCIYMICHPFTEGIMHFDTHYEMAIHVISCILVLGITVFYLGSFFYFSYVKKGTKFLCFQLVIMSFFGIYSLIKGWISGEFYWIIYFLSLLQTLIFIYYSINLLLINLFHKLTDKHENKKAGKILNFLKKRYRRYC